MKPMAGAQTAKSAEPLCWSCEQPAGTGPVCDRCQKLQPLPERADRFRVLGLASRKMDLDPRRLEESFHSLSRQVHPDRFQTRSPEERRIAEERSAALNVAYRTLRDPHLRAGYLLELEGLSPDSPAAPPAELLMEMMELQESAEAYRASDPDDPSRVALERSLRASLEELEGRREALEAELLEAFRLWDQRVVDEGSSEARGPLLDKMRSILDARRYLANTIRDLSAALAGEPPPERTGS